MSSDEYECLNSNRNATVLIAIFALATLLLGILGSGCSSDHETRLTEIRSMQSSGQLGDAIEALEEIVAQEPDLADAQFLLGQAYLQIDQPRSAIPALEQAAKDGKFTRLAGLLLASTLFELMEYEESIDASSRVLAVDPINVIALLTRGRSHLARGKGELALADANQILEIEPNHQNAIRLKGGALIDLDRHDEAEKVWINLHTRLSSLGNPNDAARACGQLALFYRSQRMHESADRTYQKCLSQYPTHAYLQRWASHFYIRRGEHERAVELHRNAIAAAPDDLRLWARLSNVLLSTGEPDDARATLEETVERFDSPESWSLLAEFHLKTGDAQQARKALEEAIQRADEPLDASLFALAELVISDGDYELAREIGTRLSEPTYRHLIDGSIDLHAGDPAGALEHFEAALATWPQNPRTRFLAGEAALALGDRKRAEAEYSRALKLGERATDAGLRLAEMYELDGRIKAALSVAVRHIARRPYAGPAPYRIAIHAALNTGNLAVATSTAEALRNADPNGSAWLIQMHAIMRKKDGPKSANDYVLDVLPSIPDVDRVRILDDLCEALHQRRQGEDALVVVDAAIEADNENAPLYALRARTLFDLERFEAAASANDRALDLDDGEALALRVRASFAAQSGETRNALAALDAAANADPERAVYPYAASTVARAADNRSLSETYLEKALEIDPEFAPAASDLAWMLAADERELGRALRLARMAAREAGSAGAREALGFVQHQRGDFAGAVTSFRSALLLDPSRQALKFRLGASLAAGGQIQEARRVLEELLAGPNFPERDAARAELARLNER